MLSGSEESNLVRAAAAGDGPAFARLYEAYERRIFNYLLRLLGDRHGAEDATQEAFIKVMAKLPDLDHENLQFGAYLYTAARNAGYDLIAGRKKMEPTGAVPEQAEMPSPGELSDLETDPERAALASSQESAVRAANERLPDRQREVLALRELDGLSYDEIGSVMEMKPNAVAQLISRARIGLRKEMRAGAAASVAFASAECEKAHAALACRQDAQPDDPGDWLDGHLAVCPNCQVASEEMAEAGVSYRAWAPVLPAAWLFREVMAKANEITGHDWSAVERPDGSAGARPAGRGRRSAMVAAGAVLVAAIFATFLLADADAPERFERVREAVIKPIPVKKKPKRKAPEKAKAEHPEEPAATPGEIVTTPVTTDPGGSVPPEPTSPASPPRNPGPTTQGGGDKPAISGPGSFEEPTPAPPEPTPPETTPPTEPTPPVDPGPSTPLPGGPPNLANPDRPKPG